MQPALARDLPQRPGSRADLRQDGVRICAALGTTPDDILGVSPSAAMEDAAMSEVLASLRQLDGDGLALVSALIRTIAAHRDQVTATSRV